MKKDLLGKKEEQTVSKHNILENYLEPWIRILSAPAQKWVKRLYYVDAFAGRGRFVSGEEGSPLIGAKILKKYWKPQIKYYCVCIEKETERAKELENELKEFRDKVDVKIYHGEFNDLVNELIKEIRKYPAFFFIDPEGFSGTSFSAIENILNLPHKELLINFQYNAIQRWLKADRVERTISDLFGTDRWMDIVKRGLQRTQKERVLIELYKSQLRLKGYYVWYFNNKFPQKNRTFYYLVYATKNLTGFKIMKEVIFKEGSRRYFEPNLFKEIEFAEFQRTLLEKYKGNKVPYNNVLAYVLQETDYLARDLDSVMKKVGIKKEPNPERKGNPFLCFPSSYKIVSSTKFQIQENSIPQTLFKITAKPPRIVYDSEGLVKQVADGSIIKRFDKTPYPVKPTNVVCPHFLELKWAYGCPFDCSWCYLKGTFRFRAKGIKPAYKPLEKVKLHVEIFLHEVKNPEILNTGEIADSLMGENGDCPFSKFIISLFEKQNRHKVLFVTKSTNVKNLLGIASPRQVIVSFSLNAKPVAERWEKKAPLVKKRIEAAKKLFDADYEVRIRIDPMVPIENWEKCYIELIEEIFSRFIPERITLGSLRGLQSTINGTKDTSWVKYLKEGSNWGRKIDFTTRYKMYTVIIEQLGNRYNYYNIALCKETKAMWEKLGMNWKRIRCNCVW